MNRIIIPSYDSEGKLNYFVGRDFYNSNFKYKNPPFPKDIVGFDLYINWSLPIILTEGVFDAMSIRTNAIPMLSKKPSKSLLRKIFENSENFSILEIKEKNLPHSLINKKLLRSIA